jgi:hypothetical protein
MSAKCQKQTFKSCALPLADSGTRANCRTVADRGMLKRLLRRVAVLGLGILTVWLIGAGAAKKPWHFRRGRSRSKSACHTPSS